MSHRGWIPPLSAKLICYYGHAMSAEINKEKSRQLKMPFGTASHRLRQMIMYDLLFRLDENVCFKCGEMIESVADLSIEHKVPWLRNDTRLFWDLGNIAFSHKKCNTPDRPGKAGGLRKIISPPGMSWCAKHRDHLPVEKFRAWKNRWNGKLHYCKECESTLRKRFPSRRKKVLSADTQEAQGAGLQNLYSSVQI